MDQRMGRYQVYHPCDVCTDEGDRRLYVTWITTVWCHSGRIVDRAVLRLYSPGGSLLTGLNLGIFVIHR